MTLRDDPGMRSARPASAGLPPEADAGPLPGPCATPGEAGRCRYAVGVFAVPSEALGAIAALASEGCDVLVVCDRLWSEANAAHARQGRITFRPIDSSGALAGNLSALLGESGPFAALGGSVGGKPDEAQTAAPGNQRLFHNLVHHLAAGAAVVIVRASGTEQQLHVSRALLDARCDILLTHDVLQSTHGTRTADGNGAEACCQSCGARPCTDTPVPPLSTS